MPTARSIMDKIEGPTSQKGFRTIVRQKEAEAKRLVDRVARSKSASPQRSPECDWRRLMK